MQTYTNKAEFFRIHTAEEIEVLLKEAGFEAAVKRKSLSLEEWRKSTHRIMASDRLVLLCDGYVTKLVAFAYCYNQYSWPGRYEVMAEYFVADYRIKYDSERNEVVECEIKMSDGTIIDKLDAPIYVRPYLGYDDLTMLWMRVSECREEPLLSAVHNYCPPRRKLSHEY